MQIVIGVLISLAAAMLFFLIEPFLLGLDETQRLVWSGVVFLLVVGIIVVLTKLKSNPSKDPRSIAERNEAGKDLSIELDKVRAKDGSGNIASDNKSGGKTTIKISDSDL